MSTDAHRLKVFPACGSQPGSHYIADLGAEARHLIDLLAASGQKLCLISPLGPLDEAACPYSVQSAWAGNPLLLSLEDLRPLGLLFTDELASLPEGRAPYRARFPFTHYKLPLLHRALGRLSGPLRQAFYAFCYLEQHWLDDYVLFASLNHEQAAPWYEWSPELRDREPLAMATARRRLQEERRFHAFCQFIFRRQWHALRDYARERGVELVGASPIAVGLNSADHWAQHQQCGNPVYEWQNMTAMALSGG
ncbi:MAG: 4-alpha-glucanotransferase [Aeromonadaceae bacterium]